MAASLGVVLFRVVVVDVTVVFGVVLVVAVVVVVVVRGVVLVVVVVLAVVGRVAVVLTTDLAVVFGAERLKVVRTLLADDGVVVTAGDKEAFFAPEWAFDDAEDRGFLFTPAPFTNGAAGTDGCRFGAETLCVAWEKT